ncbi:MAG: hypothetical protein RID07_01090, partial [Lacipirellulaceae bacterium]
QASETECTIAAAIAECDGEPSDGRGPRGRDVVCLAGVALRHAIGSLRAAACEEKVLTPQLRSSAALLLERSEWLSRLKSELGTALDELVA